MPVEINLEVYDNCGTYAGVQRHNRNKTPKCEACKRANREYIKAWRHSSGHSKGTWVYVPDGHEGLLDTIQGLLRGAAV